MPDKSLDPKVLRSDPDPAAPKLEELALAPRPDIPRYRIDMARHLCGNDENAYLVGKLQALDLYRPDLRYTVIHPACLQTVEETGLYRRKKDGSLKHSIYCLETGTDYAGFHSLVHAGGMFTWRTYSEVFNQEAQQGVPIIVYNASMLKSVPKYLDMYKITCPHKPDAMVAIVLLDNF